MTCDSKGKGPPARKEGWRAPCVDGSVDTYARRRSRNLPIIPDRYLLRDDGGLRAAFGAVT